VPVKKTLASCYFRFFLAKSIFDAPSFVYIIEFVLLNLLYSINFIEGDMLAYIKVQTNLMRLF
jgi:hypothetical protein